MPDSASATPTPPPGKKREGEEKGRPKNRRAREIVASASVFSMGPAERAVDRHRGWWASNGVEC